VREQHETDIVRGTELEARRHASAGNVVLLHDARRKGGAQ
jgi:hypothetical protein